MERGGALHPSARGSPGTAGPGDGCAPVVLFGSGTAGALTGGLLADSFGLTAPFHLAGVLVVLAAAGVAVVFHRSRRPRP
ncbi:hypothetical protein [Streptomyces albidoflavus]|uniref:hypothetical protein n=1 Tax=Streptomyces albidoflavus TaxID=1886 RepID=UPI001140D0CC|nr:hypothetical protein [Streptomyces albidoflavus]